MKVTEMIIRVVCLALSVLSIMSAWVLAISDASVFFVFAASSSCVMWAGMAICASIDVTFDHKKGE